MYEDKQIRTAIETKFLRLVINSTLSWKTHIEYSLIDKHQHMQFQFQFLFASVWLNTVTFDKSDL